MSDHLNVCLISSEFFPVWGGVGSYTVNLIRHLPQDLDIHLITMSRKYQGLKENCCSETHLAPRDLRQKLNIHYVCSAEETFLCYFKFQLSCLKKIPQLHKSHKFDLVHTQFPIMPDVFARILREVRIPTVCTIHSTVKTQLVSITRDLNFSRMDRSEKGNLLFYIPLRLCEYFYLKSGIRGFITVSNFIKRELTRTYGFIDADKIHTIYHGVDPEAFSPSVSPTNRINDIVIPDSKPIVLFTGRIVSKKGVNVLVRAIPKVLAHIPDACFVFAGGGDFHPYMKTLKRLGVSEDHFVYLGHVKDSDMPRLYSLATVYVAPSLEDSLGIRILEAMSVGKTVIASKVGGIPEIIRPNENGVLVTPGDSNELAEQIVSCLEDKDLRRKLGRKARKTVVTRFSVKTMANKTFDLYKNTSSSF